MSSIVESLSSSLPSLSPHQQPISFLGYQWPNKRYNDFHVINPNHTWDIDIKKFPGFQNSFAFERAFVPIGNDVQLATLEKWHYSIYISIIYMIVIFGIQKVMQPFKGFGLRGPLVAWNMLLAAFSLFGVYRCLPEFLHIIYHEGFVASYTKATYYFDYRLSVWYLFFTLSKAIELVDTLFIVLRKSKLIPLHWVHHLLTLNFSWFVFADVPATARWMVNMNFFVHSMMYTYYALKATGGVRISRKINFTITTLQVTQMFVGLIINYECLKRKLSGEQVDISYSVALTGFTLYFLFAILFVRFFIRAYVFRSNRTAIQTILTSDINHNVVKKLQ